MNQTPADDRGPEKARLPRWLWTPIRARVLGPYLLGVAGLPLFCVSGVLVWKLTPLAPPRFVLPSQTNVLALSPDDRVLVTLHQGEISLWDVETAASAGRLAERFTPSVRCDFSNDCRWLATCDGGKLHVWAVASAQKQFTVRLTEKKAYYPAVAFSPDGTLLAFTADNPKPEIKLWDVAARRERAVVPGSTTGLHFSPDAKLLAYQRLEPQPNEPSLSVLYVWDLVTGEKRPLDAEPGLPRLLAFTPDGDSLATAQQSRILWEGAYEVKRWRLNPTTVRQLWLLPRGAGLLRVGPEGKFLVVQNREPASDHYELTILDAAGANDPEMPPKQPTAARASILSPDSRRFARFIQPSLDPPAIVELPSLDERPLTPLPDGQRLGGGEFSPDGKWFALLGRRTVQPAKDKLKAWLQQLFKNSQDETELHLYDTATGRLHQSVPGVIGPRIRFTSDGRRLIVLTHGQIPTVWDLPLHRRWLQLSLSWAALAMPLLGGWWLYRRRRRP